MKEVRDAMLESGVWKASCPVPLERLATIKIRYIDFDGVRHEDGELVVFDAAAPRAAKIFEELFALQFPIARIRPMHHYGGDDDASMADNNSSCFNFRNIPDGSTVSIHGYGFAIDVNPVQNPFVQFQNDDGLAKIHPCAGWEYLNRHNRKPGMVEPIVHVFEENGFFVWGGKWTTPIDFHHFQPPRVVVSLIAGVSLEDGKRLFEICIEHRQAILERAATLRVDQLLDIYSENRQSFFKAFTDALV